MTEAKSVRVEVVDNDTAGVTVSPTSISAPEGGAAGSYTVVLDTEPSGTVTVTVDGAGDDLTVSPSTLTFDGTTWATVQTVTVEAVDDVLDEGQEEVTLSHTARGGGYDGVRIAALTVTVVDNDAAGVTVGPTSIAVAEGGAGGSYTVMLDTEPSGTVTVTVEDTGDDVTVSPSTLTFDGTTWATAQTVTVEAVDNAIVEGQEEVTLTHTVAGYGEVTEAADVTVTVVDNDAAGVTVGPTSISATEGGAAGSYRVVLGSEPSGTVTVTVDGAVDDLKVSPSTVTFDGTTWATAQTVMVEAVDDAIAEGQEEVTLTHMVAGYGEVTEAADVTVTVVDNDTAGVTVSHSALTVHPLARAHYTVVLDSQPSGTVTVSVEGSSADVEVSPSTLTFNERTWSTPQTVTVFAVLATDPISIEYVPPHTLTHTVTGYGSVAKGLDVTVTVVDNGAPGVTVSPTSISAAEGGAAGSYTVVLDGEPWGTVTVTVGGAGDDVSVSPSTLTFDGTTWATAQTVMVEAVDDAIAEGQEEVTLTHTVAAYGEVTEAADVTVTVVVDDGSPATAVALALDPDSVTEDGGAQTIKVMATLNGAARTTATTVTVSRTGGGTAESGTDYAAVTDFTVTIPANQTSGTRAFSFEPRDDNVVEGNETVVLTGSTTGLTAGTATLTILASDAPGTPPGNSPATGAPRITGSAQARETLAAETTGIADADGLENVVYRYQWIRSDGVTEEAIAEATGESYQVQEADVGRLVRVRVVFRDDRDNEETLESAPVRVTARVTAGAADVNRDGAIDGDDALVMYYAYTYGSLLGNGDEGGFERYRREQLGGLSGVSDPTDEDLRALLRAAKAWRSAGLDAGGDVNRDGAIDGDDALVMYYAYTYGSLLGNGDEGGFERYRREQLGGLSGVSNPTDEDLRRILRNAHALR